MNAFGDIRAILQRGASEATWEALCDVLAGQFGEVRLGEESKSDVALAYCREHLKSWPKDLPTFAPRSWFQRPAEALAQRTLTSFFSFCVTERTTVFLAKARAELATCKASAPPKFIKLSGLGELKWRDGEAFGEPDHKRLIALLRAHHEQDRRTPHKRKDALPRLRQLLDDEDIERWTFRLFQQGKSAPSDTARAWTLTQFGYFAARHQFGFGVPHVDVLEAHAWANPTVARQSVEMLKRFGDRDSLTTLWRLALDTPRDHPCRETAAHALEWMSHEKTYQRPTHLRVMTRYHEPLFDVLVQSAKETKGALGRWADVFTRAMIEQAQIPATCLLSLLDGEGVEHTALGWIVFATSEWRFFQVTDIGLRDLRGDEVTLTPDDYVLIAHPVSLEVTGELGDWWARFAEVELDEFSVQFERDIYPSWSPRLPPGSFALLHPEHLEALGLVQTNAFREQSITPRGGGTITHAEYDRLFRHSEFCYSPRGYNWEVVFHIRDYEPSRSGHYIYGEAHVDRVDVRAKVGTGILVPNARITNSEVCRIAHIVQLAVTYDQLSDEEMLPYDELYF